MLENREQLNTLIQEIWKSANSLRGKFKSYENQNIVLPMITIRRIECVLQKWRDDEQVKIKRGLPDATDEQIQQALKQRELSKSNQRGIYNTTDWNLLQLHNEDSTS